MVEPTVYSIGELVQFQYGVSKVKGMVKEDRGPIGVKGRRLDLIRFALENSPEFSIELPADEMERVPAATSSS